MHTYSFPQVPDADDGANAEADEISVIELIVDQLYNRSHPYEQHDHSLSQPASPYQFYNRTHPYDQHDYSLSQPVLTSSTTDQMPMINMITALASQPGRQSVCFDKI